MFVALCWHLVTALHVFPCLRGAWVHLTHTCRIQQRANSIKHPLRAQTYLLLQITLSCRAVSWPLPHLPTGPWREVPCLLILGIPMPSSTTGTLKSYTKCEFAVLYMLYVQNMNFKDSWWLHRDRKSNSLTALFIPTSRHPPLSSTLLITLPFLCRSTLNWTHLNPHHAGWNINVHSGRLIRENPSSVSPYLLMSNSVPTLTIFSDSFIFISQFLFASPSTSKF